MQFYVELCKPEFEFRASVLENDEHYITVTDLGDGVKSIAILLSEDNLKELSEMLVNYLSKLGEQRRLVALIRAKKEASP